MCDAKENREKKMIVTKTPHTYEYTRVTYEDILVCTRVLVVCTRMLLMDVLVWCFGHDVVVVVVYLSTFHI